jgi:BolA family transcriptional regulator, general stress-responsive regulator
MSAETRMREALMVGLQPTRLDVINESELHAGHRSSPGTGESHFRLLIVSPAFTGLSRVARHRLVNTLLAAELAGSVHALALSTYAPTEPLPT